MIHTGDQQLLPDLIMPPPHFLPQFDNLFFSSQFYNSFVEALQDDESNDLLLMIMNAFSDDVASLLYVHECNERFMFIMITYCICTKRLNERMLKKRSELMVRFVIRDDQYLLFFLYNLSLRCEFFGLSLEDMDCLVQTLQSEGVISCFVANHWLLARSAPGQLGNYEYRRKVIGACLVLKKQFNNHCDTEDDF